MQIYNQFEIYSFQCYSVIEFNSQIPFKIRKMSSLKGVMMSNPKYLTKLEQILAPEGQDLEKLKQVEQKYPFRANDYYLSLINWDDPDDPIRKIIIPQEDELESWGATDPSCESKYTKMPGLQHKYEPTALLLVNDYCGSYCRFCFRKRLFINRNVEVVRDFNEDIEYIAQHKEINNVLLTGGDPLVLPTNKINSLLSKLSYVDHLKIIRIGTKIPAFNPYRLLNDESFFTMIKKYCHEKLRLYFIMHFNHPRELTQPALELINRLRESGAVMCNQTPVLKGINDRPEILRNLFEKLANAGVPPYYVFQCRPTIGNKPFALPIEQSFKIYESARKNLSGLAKRARFIISHETGKLSVAGLTKEHIIMKTHMPVDANESGKMMIFKRNPEAYWFDDYKEKVEEYKIIEE